MRSLSLFVALLILGSTTIIPAEVYAASNKSNAEIRVWVKNLPKDWRADTGSKVTLYDDKTGEWVIGYQLIKGKATFKNLKQNQRYHIVLSVAGFSEIRKSIITKKKKSEVTIKLPKEDSSDTQDIVSSAAVTVSPILPGASNAATRITQGSSMEIWVNVSAPKSGTVQTYLVNSDRKVKLLLASSWYVTTGGGEFTVLTQRSGVIAATVPTGSGYKILATFVSDDGILKKEEEMFGLAFVASAASGSPRITSFSGPSSLRVGEEGTWKLEATPSTGQTASCRIWWGQDPLIKNNSSKLCFGGIPG